MTSTPPKDQGPPTVAAIPLVPPQPNQKALDVMKAIQAIHARMNPRIGRSSVEIIREAREGAMHD